jgi:UDP-N-acetylglucosamine 2-epimerase (non-hydrolysing)
MKDIKASEKLELQVIVAGTHLSPEFGSTWTNIVTDGFRIDAKVEMLLSSDSGVGVAKSMGLGTIGFADALARLLPDVLVVLGDRYEALSIAQAAVVLGIPIAHIHGGEITEGAYDDLFRHAITKMSSLHFAATDQYRRRIVQMGESPGAVFNVGAVGLDHLSRSEMMPAMELAEDMGLQELEPFFLVTYHPVTAEDEDPVLAVQQIFTALDRWPDHKVVVTYPNADNGGRSIVPIIEAYVESRCDRARLRKSLGIVRYMSLMSRAAAVVGNSSSGIIEAPALGAPTVDIGARQRGRLAAKSVIHAEPEASSIHAALSTAVSPEFRAALKNQDNPYGQGEASRLIVNVLESWNGRSNKRFCDLEFDL